MHFVKMITNYCGSELTMLCMFRGNWHGDVAIKMLNMDHDSNNQSQLEAFKLEVSLTITIIYFFIFLDIIYSFI